MQGLLGQIVHPSPHLQDGAPLTPEKFNKTKKEIFDKLVSVGEELKDPTHGANISLASQLATAPAAGPQLSLQPRAPYAY